MSLMVPVLMLLFFGVFFLISIGCLVFWIWMLVDCAQREFPGPNDKVMWVLVIVLTGAIGALIYLIVGRPNGQRV